MLTVTKQRHTMDVLHKAIRVLWVEDDPVMLEVGKEMLESMRLFRVDTALDVDEALDMHRSGAYHFCILDLMFENKVCPRLVQQCAARHPVIAVTGIDSTEFAFDIGKLGIVDLVRKPVTWNESSRMCTAIRRAVFYSLFGMPETRRQEHVCADTFELMCERHIHHVYDWALGLGINENSPGKIHINGGLNSKGILTVLEIMDIAIRCACRAMECVDAYPSKYCPYKSRCRELFRYFLKRKDELLRYIESCAV